MTETTTPATDEFVQAAELEAQTPITAGAPDNWTPPPPKLGLWGKFKRYVGRKLGAIYERHEEKIDAVAGFFIGPLVMMFVLTMSFFMPVIDKLINGAIHEWEDWNNPRKVKPAPKINWARQAEQCLIWAVVFPFILIGGGNTKEWRDTVRHTI